MKNQKISFLQFRIEEILFIGTYIIYFVYKKYTFLLADAYTNTFANLNFTDYLHIIPIILSVLYFFNLLPNVDKTHARDYCIIQACIIGLQFLGIWGFSVSTSQHFHILIFIGNLLLMAVHCLMAYLVVCRIVFDIYDGSCPEDSDTDLYD